MIIAETLHHSLVTDGLDLWSLPPELRVGGSRESAPGRCETTGELVDRSDLPRLRGHGSNAVVWPHILADHPTVFTFQGSSTRSADQDFPAPLRILPNHRRVLPQADPASGGGECSHHPRCVKRLAQVPIDSSLHTTSSPNWGGSQLPHTRISPPFSGSSSALSRLWHDRRAGQARGPNFRPLRQIHPATGGGQQLAARSHGRARRHHVIHHHHHPSAQFIQPNTLM